MRVNHNINALNAWRNSNLTVTQMGKTLEKLSSGFRINRAGDDAAGLAISEKMRAQIKGLDQASRNAQDSISLIQTAEGALNETHSILQRMRELAVQAASDTNVTVDRSEIQKELNQLTSEINRIGNTTEFNTMKLIDGSRENTLESYTGVFGNASGAANAAITGLSGLTTITFGSGASIASGAATVNITRTAEDIANASGAVAARVSGTTGENIGNNFTGNQITLTGDLNSYWSGGADGIKVSYDNAAQTLTVQSAGSSGAVNDVVNLVNGQVDYDNFGIKFSFDASGLTADGVINFDTSGAGAGAAVSTASVSGLSGIASVDFSGAGLAYGEVTLNITKTAEDIADEVGSIATYLSGSGGNSTSSLSYSFSGNMVQLSGAADTFWSSGSNGLIISYDHANQTITVSGSGSSGSVNDTVNLVDGKVEYQNLGIKFSFNASGLTADGKIEFDTSGIGAINLDTVTENYGNFGAGDKKGFISANTVTITEATTDADYSGYAYHPDEKMVWTITVEGVSGSSGFSLSGVGSGGTVISDYSSGNLATAYTYSGYGLNFTIGGAGAVMSGVADGATYTFTVDPKFTYTGSTVDSSGNTVSFTIQSGVDQNGLQSGTYDVTGGITLNVSGAGVLGIAEGGSASGSFEYSFDSGASTLNTYNNKYGNLGAGAKLEFISGSTILVGEATTDANYSGADFHPDEKMVWTITLSGVSGSNGFTLTGVGSGGTTITDSWSGDLDNVAGGYTYSGYGLTFTIGGSGAVTDVVDGATFTFTVEPTFTFSGAITDASGTQNFVIASGVGQSGLQAADYAVAGDLTLTVSGNGILGMKTGSEVADSGDFSVVNSYQSGTNNSLNFQIGSNQYQALGLDINDMRSKAVGVSTEGATTQWVEISRKYDDLVDAGLMKSGTESGVGGDADKWYIQAYFSDTNVTNGTDSTGVERGLSMSTHEHARAAVTVINDAIERVSAERSKLGANQNRLEHTINNLGVASENLTAAESRIRDADMAAEMMKFTKQQILMQSANAMLSQANQLPQNVLQLLR